MHDWSPNIVRGATLTVMDFMVVIPGLYTGRVQSRVSEEFTGSYHGYLVHVIRYGGGRGTRRVHTSIGCVTTKFDGPKFDAAIAESENAYPTSSPEGLPPAEIVRILGDKIKRAYDTATPLYIRHDKPAYWWTNLISVQRKSCQDVSRRVVRLRKRGVSVLEGVARALQRGEGICEADDQT